jgi:hypothetical protein
MPHAHLSQHPCLVNFRNYSSTNGAYKAHLVVLVPLSHGIA